MLYVIINVNYLFLWKKISCLRLYDLKVEFDTLFIEDFNKNIRLNPITFTYCDLLSKNLKKKGGIKTCHI